MAMRLPLLSLLVVLALGGCSSGDDDGGVRVQSPLPPTGTFLSTAVTGRTLVPGTRVTLTFEDGSLSANAGCNHLGGEFAMDGDVLVINGGLITTEIGCDQARHEQDEWLASLLQARPTIAVAGETITISGPDSSLTLQDREVADPDRPLVGTQWDVDTIISGETASTVPAEHPATVRFLEGGRVELANGCSVYAGTYRLSDDVITVSGLKPEVMARCLPPDPVDLSGIVRGEVGYEITGDRLRLHGADDQGLEAAAAED